MPDIWLEWNGDFVISASGGLLLADGDDYARQRILRRLFTAIDGYVWHADYGAGLPQKIGSPARQSVIQSLVQSQIALEASVASSPPPIVVVTQDQNQRGLFNISISYISAANGGPVSLTFSTS